MPATAIANAAATFHPLDQSPPRLAHKSQPPFERERHGPLLVLLLLYRTIKSIQCRTLQSVRGLEQHPKAASTLIIHPRALALAILLTVMAAAAAVDPRSRTGPSRGDPPPLRVQVASYNFNLQGDSTPFPDLQSWLVPTLSETRKEYTTQSMSHGREAPDIYAVGFQELLPLHLAFADGEAAEDVRDHTSREIRRSIRHHAAVTRPDGLYPPGSGPEDYTVLAEVHLVAITLFVLGRNKSRIPERVKEMRTSTAATGFFNLMGNKGAVGVRLVLDSTVPVMGSQTLGESQTEVLTFVCAHLAAHDHNAPRRNQDFQSIVQRLAFAPNAASALPLTPASAQPDLKRGEAVDSAKLQEQYEATQQPTKVPATQRKNGVEAALDDKTYSLYDSHHTFFFGDLNYRIALDKPKSASKKDEGGGSGSGLTKHDVRRKVSQQDYAHLAPHDQLNQHRQAGRTLHGFVDWPLRLASFGPTYKYKPQRSKQDAEGNVARDRGNAPLKDQEMSPKRVPGWTDRILWISNQGKVAGFSATGKGEKKAPTTTSNDTVDAAQLHGVNVELYRSIMGYTLSDHKPITLIASLPAPTTFSSRLAPYQLDRAYQAHYRAAGKTLDGLVGFGWSLLISMGAGRILVGVSEVVVIALISVWWLRSGGQGGDLGYWFGHFTARP